MGGEQAGGLVAVVHAQPLARLVDVGVDRVLGDAEPAADLLGAEVLLDESKALPLTRRQEPDDLERGWAWLAHAVRLTT